MSSVVACTLFAVCPVQLSAPYLLCPALVGTLVLVVDAAEVGDDDGNGQGDDQHPAQRADGAEDLPGDGLGHHVTIAGGEKHTQGRFPFQTRAMAPKAFSGSLSSNASIQTATNPPCCCPSSGLTPCFDDGLS